MHPTAVLDGELIPFRELRLEPFAEGFFFGAGLFETLLIEHGIPHFVGRHLARLSKGLRELSVVRAPAAALLDEGAMRRALGAATRDVAGRSTPFTGVAKITASDGHVLITFRDLPATHEELLRAGVDIEQVERTSYRSGDPLAVHKTLSYLRQYRHLGTRLLFANELGEICEGPIANMFVRIGDEIVTPPTSAPCLAGVIREVIVERGEALGLPVVERPIREEELASCTACVLTNSLYVALPVRTLPMCTPPVRTPPTLPVRTLVPGELLAAGSVALAEDLRVAVRQIAAAEADV